MKTAVIVTVYKRYNYVNEAINSVLHQTVLPDQIVVVTDNTKIIENSQNFHNLTTIEANYPDYGKKIVQAINSLDDDIDIVFFLEDDDIFDKYKIEYIKRIFERNNNLVMIHNLQKYIDINGKEINNSFTKSIEETQPQEDTIINLDNIFVLINRYPFLGFNISSMSIKKDILDKYKNFINELKIMLDTSLLFISVLEGNVLHISNRLTYFRIGSGISSYGNITNYTDFLKNQHKIICLQNKILEDLRKLYKIVKNYESCRKIVERGILIHETDLYLLNNYFNCDYKASTSSYTSLLFRCIKYLFNNEISLSEFIIYMAKLNLPLIYGKKKSSELILKRRFKQILELNTK
ncbi:glycosyltransferase [Stygiolobus azoricus]|nr:glycosyltransferase [Stygiolobus azoricus]